MNDRYRTDRIVELDRFVNVGEAMAVKNLLEHNDIRAVIDGEAMAGLFGSYMGPNIAGVRVRVFESDLQRARELVAHEWEEADDFSDDDSPATDEPPSNETNLEDSTAAGAEFLGTEQKIPSPQHASPSEHDDYEEDEHAPATAPAATVGEPSEDLVRAWRASCMSLMLFPMLMNVYSLWILFRKVSRTERENNWRSYATVLMNFVVLGFYGLLLVWIIFDPFSPRSAYDNPGVIIGKEAETDDGEDVPTQRLAEPKWVERTIP